MAKRKFFHITDFSGGYNPDRNPQLLKDNEATSILNVRLDRAGSLVARSGYDLLTDGVTVGFPTMLGSLRDANSPQDSQLLVKSGTGVYLVNVDAGTFLELATGFDAGPGEFCSARNVVIYANGSNRPVYYDGTNYGMLGLAAPSAAPTLATSGTGLSGTFKYAYSYFDSVSGAESSVSSSASETPSNQGVKLTMALPTDDRVDSIRVYRTSDNGTVLRLLDTIAAATTYTDDGTKTLTTVVAPSDNDLPPYFEHMAFFAGYFFGSMGTTLYWSKPQQPDAWPALNSTDVPFEGVDTIKALVSHQDSLLIFGRSNVLVLNGDSGVWTIARLSVSLGAVNAHAVTEVNGTLVFLSADGLRAFPSMAVVAPQIRRELAGKSDALLDEARLAYVPDELALWLSVDGGTYVIQDSPNQAVSRYDLAPIAILPAGASGSGSPTLLFSGQSNIFQYGGHTDLGVDIPIKWTSKSFTLADSDSGLEAVKFFRRIGAYATVGAASTVTINIRDKSGNASSVVLESVNPPTQLLWNQFTWDQATWPSEGLGYFLGALPAQSLVGRVVEVSVSANTNAVTEIAPPITLEYREVARFLGR